MVYRILVLIAFLFVFQHFCVAQVSPATKDSIRYKAFEVYAHKRKVTRIIHNLLFKPFKPEIHNKRSEIEANKTRAFQKAERKVIRSIHIATYDPFGYYMQDATVKPKGFFSKAGNRLHLKTRAGTIKNLLLFKENERFDSLVVLESERLLRSQKYLRNVKIYTALSPENGDSIDVFVRAFDVWSILPEIGMTTSAIETGLSDINFIGLGHRFQAHRKWSMTASPHTTRFTYFVPNIGSSYISSDIRYISVGKVDSVKSIGFSRNFYSPVTKWAGGIFLGQMKTANSFIRNDSIIQLSSRVNQQDYWAARSWQVLKKNAANAPVSNFILSARLARLNYPTQQAEAYKANLFNDQTTLFAGIGFTSRKYIRDQLIFDFGKVEDVPIGKLFGITFGMDIQQQKRFYFGAKAAIGNFYSFGYLSSHLEYGSFLGASGLQQGAFICRLNYFTNLLSLGRWKIRQFVKPAAVMGLNRLVTDKLTFNTDMEGFQNLVYSASAMLVLTLQTQSYAPWNFIGFHFGPYFFTSLGMLGNASSGFKHSQLYAVMGLGVLVKNEYLMFSTFQFSVSYYPVLPGKGFNVFKLNAFETSDYGFRDFEISKPDIVVYK